MTQDISYKERQLRAELRYDFECLMEEGYAMEASITLAHLLRRESENFDIEKGGD